jgi:hypothetical protein
MPAWSRPPSHHLDRMPLSEKAVPDHRPEVVLDFTASEGIL